MAVLSMYALAVKLRTCVSVLCSHASRPFYWQTIYDTTSMIGWGIDTLVSTTCIVMNLLTCLFLITYNELRQREIHRERELRFCLKSSSLLEINSSVAYHTRLQFTKTHKLNNGTLDLQSSQNRPKYFYFATLCKQLIFNHY